MEPCCLTHVKPFCSSSLTNALNFIVHATLQDTHFITIIVAAIVSSQERTTAIEFSESREQPARVIQLSVSAHAYPGSAGVSPAPEVAKMAALPGKARQVLAQTGKLNDPGPLLPYKNCR